MIELGESMFIETVDNEIINLNSIVRIKSRPRKVDSKLQEAFIVELFDVNEMIYTLGYILDKKDLIEILSTCKKDKLLTKEQCIKQLDIEAKAKG